MKKCFNPFNRDIEDFKRLNCSSKSKEKKAKSTFDSFLFRFDSPFNPSLIDFTFTSYKACLTKSENGHQYNMV